MNFGGNNSAHGIPWWLSNKEPACNVGGAASIPGSGRSPEKETATHSSILAWGVPWTEEPGGLQAMGSQRVRHNLETKPPPIQFIAWPKKETNSSRTSQ